MAGPDGKDPSCEPLPLVPVALPITATSNAVNGSLILVPDGPLPVGDTVVSSSPITAWANVTIFTVADLVRCTPQFSSAIDPAILTAIERASRVLTAAPSSGGYGARLGTPFPLPELVDAFDLWSAVMTDADQPSFRALLEQGHGGALDLGWEMARWALGASEATIPALVLAFIEDLPERLLPGRHRVLLETVGKLRARIHDTLAAANGVLLLPVHPVTAPLHDEAWLHPHNVGYTGLFNVLETPATAVPMGLDEETGVPVAIQASSSRASPKAHNAMVHWHAAGCRCTRL